MLNASIDKAKLLKSIDSKLKIDFSIEELKQVPNNDIIKEIVDYVISSNNLETKPELIMWIIAKINARRLYLSIKELKDKLGRVEIEPIDVNKVAQEIYGSEYTYNNIMNTLKNKMNKITKRAHIRSALFKVASLVEETSEDELFNITKNEMKSVLKLKELYNKAANKIANTSDVEHVLEKLGILKQATYKNIIDDIFQTENIFTRGVKKASIKEALELKEILDEIKELL